MSRSAGGIIQLLMMTCDCDLSVDVLTTDLLFIIVVCELNFIALLSTAVLQHVAHSS